MIAEDTTEVKLNKLHVFLQTSLQETLIELATQTADMAKAADAHLGDFAFSAGSSLASFLYELLSDDDTTASDQITGFEQQQEAFLKSFIDGFKEKLDILKDPKMLKEVAQNTTSET